MMWNLYADTVNWIRVRLCSGSWLEPIDKDVYETIYHYDALPRQLQKDHGGEIIKVNHST